jgi:hypothetical protein
MYGDLLDKSFYYLSDENKLVYIDEFINRSIKDELRLDEYYANMLFDILKYSDYEFEDDIRDIILVKMIKGFEKHKDRVLYLEHVFGQLLVRVYDKNRIAHVKDWSSRLKDLHGMHKVNDIIEQIEEYENDLSELYYVIEDIIRDKDLIKSDEIKKYIISKGFLLPDLSGDTNQQSWSFAHVIAGYTKEAGIEQDFINYVVELCKSNSANISMIDRYDAIVRHKIDKDVRVKYLINEKRTKKKSS